MLFEVTKVVIICHNKCNIPGQGWAFTLSQYKGLVCQSCCHSSHSRWWDQPECHLIYKDGSMHKTESSSCPAPPLPSSGQHWKSGHTWKGGEEHRMRANRNPCLGLQPQAPCTVTLSRHSLAKGDLSSELVSWKLSSVQQLEYTVDIAFWESQFLRQLGWPTS